MLQKPILKMHGHMSYPSKIQSESFKWICKAGEVWILHGINGSGKTTLLESIALLKDFFVGSIDYSIPTDQIGIMTQCSKTDIYFQVEDLLRCYNSSTVQFNKIINQLHIKPLLKKSYNELSYGQMRLIHLVSVILSGTQFLLLDEPFAGIDAVTEKYMIIHLNQYCQEGGAVLITSHVNYILGLEAHGIIHLQGKHVNVHTTV